MTDLEKLLTEKLAGYRERGAARVKLALTDIDGVLRGKYVSLEKFEKLLRSGGGFCDCVFGWDVDDALYDEGRFTGWHSGFPDARFRLVTASERWLDSENCALFLGEFVGDDGEPHALCPRTRLAEVLGALADRGLYLQAGFEYEFFVFRETPLSVREKGYRNLIPLTPGNFGYSVLRASAQSDAFNGLMNLCQSMDIDLEGLHCETGPGVWEAALASATGIEAADRASLFKTFAKVYFQQRDCMATFMAKWSMDYPGQSGHFHVSLVDPEGRNVFHDPDAPYGASEVQRRAVAGLQQFLPELLVLLAPTVNSYTRLVKGAWAPTASTWGVENRTAAVRLIPGGESQRLECRVAGADANPYLVAAAVTAAMLAGIDGGFEPMDPVTGNAYDAEGDLPEALHFPGDLRASTARFAESGVARQYLGETFVDHYAMTRLWEHRERTRHLDSWQLERYFEII